MNWSSGFSVRHYASIIDPITWKPEQNFQISSGTINRSLDSLLESASIESENIEELTLTSEKWIRIYVDIRQEEDSYHGPLFTGLLSSPTQNIDGTVIKNKFQCYSVLKPAEDVLLPRGWYASANSDPADIIKTLLSVSPAPIQNAGVSGELMEPIVAEENETNLSMAWRLLDLMNWRLAIDGDGVITIDTYPVITSEAVTFDSIDHDSFETSISINYDWFSCPNVFRAVHNKAIAVARDESEDSPLSVQNRGREVWMEETNCTLQSNETLGSYAKRRLAEEQNLVYDISYTRRFHPDVNISDIIKINYPAQKLIGYFRVDSQTINLGYSVSVSEKAVKKE